VISNNLANASTNGFKRSEARFADIINEEAGTRPGVVFGKGVSTLSIERTTAQGSMMGTAAALILQLMVRVILFLVMLPMEKQPIQQLIPVPDGSRWIGMAIWLMIQALPF